MQPKPTPIKMDYTRKATVLSIHDGDTVKLSIQLRKAPKGWKNEDLTFHFYVENGWIVLHTNIRLLGINAPELSTPPGKVALDYLTTLLSPNELVTVSSELASHIIDSDKYGDRWLGVITNKDGINVNKMMLSSNNASVYYGNGPKPVPIPTTVPST